MSPADKVVAAFNGVRATARAIGLSQSTVSRWRFPKEKNGLSGRVPSIHQAKILKISREQNLGLTAEDLIHGI